MSSSIIHNYFSGLSTEQVAQLDALEDLYRHWNEKINVVSRKDIDSLYEKHVLHSLSIAAIFEFKPHTQIVDLGCGGGFPGIPLAIFFPQVQFHLVDSIAKKLKVVAEVAHAIELKNITTQHTRIESITGRQYDFVISRAVASLKNLWLWSKPLLRKKKSADDNDTALPPGLICLKGGDLTQEIADSHTRPRIWPIKEIFKGPFFEEKHLVYVTQ